MSFRICPDEGKDILRFRAERNKEKNTLEIKSCEVKGSWRDSGKKCVRVRHHRMKRDHCKVNELEVLNRQ